MNAQKFTQKSLEAIQEAQNIALEHNSMQIEQGAPGLRPAGAEGRPDSPADEKDGNRPGRLASRRGAADRGACPGLPVPAGKAGRSMCPATWIKIWPPLSGKPAG